MESVSFYVLKLINIEGIVHGCVEILFFLSVVTCEIFFHTKKRDFVSPRGYALFYKLLNLSLSVGHSQ